MQKKVVQKSVRLTMTTYEAIEGFQGEGFNNKLENLVMEYLSERDRIKRELFLLQSEIDSKHQELRYIQKKVAAARDVDVSFFSLVDAMTVFLDV